MQMSDLPNEIVALIAEFLDDEYCINALLQTCRKLSLLLNHSLYTFNVRCSHACALEWAAKNGYEATTRYTLEAGASPNATHYEEWLPMALACIHGHEVVVRLLLDHGVNPNSTESWLQDPLIETQSDDEGCPLILAAGRGHENVVRLLLSYGASPDIRCEGIHGLDISPLSIAVRQGHLSIVKLLISLGCDVRIEGWSGSSILADAAYGGHCGVVRFLLETNPDLESPQTASEALLRAAEKGHLEIVELLLEHGVTPIPTMAGRPLGPLIRAAQCEHYLVVDQLQRSMDLWAFIAHGEPDDDTHRQLLLVSAACGWEDLIEELLKRGCSSEFLHTQAMLWSIDEKLSEPIRLSLPGHPSPLALAAHRGHHRAVELLLNHKSLLSGREPTPLLLAIDGSHKGIVNTILNRGANPNHQTQNKVPVLFKAVQTPEILQLLLDHGADPGINAAYGVDADHHESILARSLRTRSLTALHILQRIVSFIQHPCVEGSYPMPFLEAAAQGGALAIRYLFDSNYQVASGSYEVGRALRIILSRADTVSLTLLFERGLVGNLVTIDDESVMGLVDSPSGDLGAMASTLDILLAYGINVEGESKSPLHDIVSRKTTNLSQLLLDRGADPLRTRGKFGTTPLGEAARHGNKDLVRIMLKGLNQRSISLEELQLKLAEAEFSAEIGQEECLAEDDVRPLLRRFYCRKKYQDMPTS
jgi:ankyrin repeat protein